MAAFPYSQQTPAPGPGHSLAAFNVQSKEPPESDSFCPQSAAFPPAYNKSGGAPAGVVNTWDRLEYQIEKFMTMQEESKKVQASFAEEQRLYLSDMRSFARLQAQLVRSANKSAVPQHHGDNVEVPVDLHEPAWDEGEEDLPSEELQGEVLDERGGARYSGSSSRWSERRLKKGKDQNSPSFAFEEDAAGNSVKQAAFVDRLASGSSSPVVMLPSVMSYTVTQQRSSLPMVELGHYSNNYEFVNLHVNIPPMTNGFFPWLRAEAAWLLHWRFFEPIMGVVIALNAFNIGWTIDKELKHEDTHLQETNEAIFLAIFILELGLRFFVHGLKVLRALASAFDALLVLVTLITLALNPLLALVGGEDVAKYLQQLMILRMLRLLRLARAVRLVASFRSLWKLVQGLVNCFGTMVSAMMLMIICIYIFACFGAELIAKSYTGDSEVGAIVASHFSSLPHIILTLFQFIAMDSTASFYVPLVERSPWLSIYFLLLLVIVAIALMNLITAVLVEDAISSAHMDDEMKGFYIRQKLRVLEPAMRQLFRSLDRSGDGYVQIREVVDAIKVGIHIPKELQDIVNPARMLDLFEALDSDQSGDISENEWVSGLTGVAVSDVPLETMQILHLLRVVRKELKKTVEDKRQRKGDFATVAAMRKATAAFGASSGSLRCTSEI